MATAEGTADAFAPPAGMWFQRLSAGSHLLHVVLQRSDAATFLREHVLLKHAKLVRIGYNFDKVTGQQVRHETAGGGPCDGLARAGPRSRSTA